MSGFTKLFSSIVTSTVWCEDYPTRLVWIAMLATADSNGVVTATIPGFARIAGVSTDEMRKAFTTLTSPDPESRSKELDGRRIIVLDNGDWQLVNYAKYRAARDQDVRRLQNREAQARYRENHVSKSKQTSADVIKVSHGQPRSAQEEVEVEVDGEAETKTQKSKKSKSCVQDTPRPPTFTPPTPDQIAAYCLEHNISIDRQRFIDHYTANGWKVGRNPMRDWEAAIRNWYRNDKTNSTGGIHATIRPQQPIGRSETNAKFAEIDASAPMLNLQNADGV